MSKSEMTPRETVSALDQFIIGQDEAKRAVAIAMRNRWRRMQLDDEFRREIYPKNILMIGPTGVGKTEIARRLADLANAPFIKIEATKFTEVGYVGRDVESIIRDLMDTAVKQCREQAMEDVDMRAEDNVEDRILDALLPQAQTVTTAEDDKEPQNGAAARQMLRKQLREGTLDDKEISVDVGARVTGVEIMAPPGMEEMTNQLQGMFQNMSAGKTNKRKIKVKDALKQLKEDEAAKLINEEEIRAKALESVEQNGIVFLDEIDKIVRNTEGTRGGDVSREGVQRDLLPLVEGSTVSTKFGMVRTDHILFIASGAFHLSKPSDLVPELQGRLPIRVELNALTAEDFVRILTETSFSLTKQYVALMATEGVILKFNKSGVRRLAEIAFQVNESTENIGARRLHTVMERLLDVISFEATDRGGETITIDKKYVDGQLNALVQDEDLSRYIL